MPGINIFICLPGERDTLESRLQASLARYRELIPWLEWSLERPAEGVLLCLSVHETQIIRKTERGQWNCYLEWEGGTAPRWERWLDDPEDDRKLWQNLASELPGAFFAAAVRRDSGELVFANDALARLPVYSLRRGKWLCLGRDVGLLLDSAEALTPDPAYLALNLTFGYVPGRGSWLRELDTLAGGTLGRRNAADGSWKESADASLRFIAPRSGGKKEERLREAADVFCAACLRLYAATDAVLGLSGGYDSRAILAALLSKGAKPRTVTYRDAENTAGQDLGVVAEISSKFDLKHQTITLQQEDRPQFEKLFWLKRGHNYLGVSFLLLWLEMLRESGETRLITGDGGDKLLPSLLPETALLSERQFLNYLFARNAILAPGEAARLTGVTVGELEEWILTLVKRYPARDWNERYKQFLLAERGGRWLFEGEDRNRYFCESRTPFYDPEFYSLALEVPEAWKRSNLFYRQFLKLLHPELARIRTAGSLLAPSHWAYGAWSATRQALRKMTWLKQLRPKPGLPSRGWINGRIESLAAKEAVMAAMPGADSLRQEGYLAGLNRLQLNQLYTILAALNGEV